MYKYNNNFKGIVRPLILLADKCKCFSCGYVDVSNNVHHIDENTKNDDICNLITVCNECHSMIHHNKFKVVVSLTAKHIKRRLDLLDFIEDAPLFKGCTRKKLFHTIVEPQN